jgi:hypothetical protein
MVPDQTDTLVILGHLCQETLVRDAIRSNPRSISSLLYIKFQEAVRKNLYGIQVVHISQLQVISKVPIY